MAIAKLGDSCPMRCDRCPMLEQGWDQARPVIWYSFIYPCRKPIEKETWDAH